MPLEKPAVVAVDPAESAKRDELTAGHARSSPHVRGTGRDAHGRVAALGITPPRGEQSTQVETDRLYLESSPRVRGAAILVNVSSIFSGIIPARAGSSCLTRCARPPRWDHPRACGEQGSPSALRRMSMGSSPRVRGAEPRDEDGRDDGGIIPARAGSSSCPAPVRAQTWDHPRACGEQSRDRRLHQGRGGSSPRVRGAVRFDGKKCDESGIIPARAGSSD